MSGLQTYLAQLTACHQAAVAKIIELYQRQRAASTGDGARPLWPGAHMLHQEFHSTRPPLQPLKANSAPARWRQAYNRVNGRNGNRR